MPHNAHSLLVIDSVPPAIRFPLFNMNQHSSLWSQRDTTRPTAGSSGWVHSLTIEPRLKHTHISVQWMKEKFKKILICRSEQNNQANPALNSGVSLVLITSRLVHSKPLMCSCLFYTRSDHTSDLVRNRSQLSRTSQRPCSLCAVCGRRVGVIFSKQLHSQRLTAVKH